MQTGTYCIDRAPGPYVLVMDTFSDLVAMATGVKSTISPKIWLIRKSQDFDNTKIYGFLHPFLHLFSHLIVIIWLFGIRDSRPQIALKTWDRQYNWVSFRYHIVINHASWPSFVGSWRCMYVTHGMRSIPVHWDTPVLVCSLHQYWQWQGDHHPLHMLPVPPTNSVVSARPVPQMAMWSLINVRYRRIRRYNRIKLCQMLLFWRKVYPLTRIYWKPPPDQYYWIHHPLYHQPRQILSLFCSTMITQIILFCYVIYFSAEADFPQCGCSWRIHYIAK